MRTIYQLIFAFLLLPHLSSIAQVTLSCDSVYAYPPEEIVLPDFFRSDTITLDEFSSATSLTLNLTSIALLPGDSLVVSNLADEVLFIITPETTPFLAVTQDTAIIFRFYGGNEGGNTAVEFHLACDFIPLNFSLLAGLDTVCPGSTVILNSALDTLFDEGDSIEIQLSNADGDFSNPQTLAEITFPANTLTLAIPSDLPAGTGYLLRILSDALDSSWNSLTTYTVPSSPETPVISGVSEFCGNAVSLLVADQFRVYFQWYLGGTPIENATDTTLNTSAPGVYAVSASGGCGLLFSEPFVLTLIEFPSIPILIADGDNQLCPGESLQLATSSDTSWNISWLANGNLLAETSDTLFITSPGTYSVSFENECGITQSELFSVTQPAIAQTPSITPSGTQTICEGTSVSLSVSEQPGIATEWLFNGNVVSSGTQFTASSEGIYTVRASGSCDTAVSDPVQMQINPLPPVLEITPAGPTILCEGNSVILFADEIPGFSYVWRRNGEFIAADTTAVSANVSGNYTLVLSNACGVTPALVPITVTINPLPVVPIIFSQGSTALCNGSSITLGVANQNSVSYQWKKNGINLSSSTNSITVSQPGLYTVILSNACGTVTSSNAVEVISGQAPVVPTIQHTGPMTFCEGGSVTLTTPPQQGALYSWFVNGQLLPLSTYSIQATIGGSYTVSVSNACDTLTSATSVNVVVNPLPPAVQISPAGSHNLCLGESLELSIPVTPAVSYQWKLGNNPAGPNSNVFNASAEGEYRIILANTCGTTPSLNTVFLNVDSLLPATPSITPQPGTALCPGGYVLLNAAPVPYQIFSWFLDGVQIPNQINPVFQATEWGVYTVRGENACGISEFSDTVSTGPGEAPDSFIIYSPGTEIFCENDSLILTAQVEFGVSVRWYKDGEFLEEGPSQIAVYQGGVYSADCWNGCGEADGTNTLTVTMLPAPEQPAITEENGLLVSSVAGELQWLDSLMVPLDGENGQTLLPFYDGNYYVEITGDDGCVSLSEPYLYLVNAIKGVLIKGVSVFPNPADSYCVVTLPIRSEGKIIQLFSVDGKLIREYLAGSGRTTVTLNFDDVSEGLYLIRFDGVSERLIIRRK